MKASTTPSRVNRIFGCTRKGSVSAIVYKSDMDAGVRAMLPRLDPTPFFAKYGENVWAGVKGYLDACTDAVSRTRRREVSGQARRRQCVYSQPHLLMMESIRLDVGFASYMHT